MKATVRLVTLIIIFAATACSDKPSTPPQSEPWEIRTRAIHSVVECLAGHEKIPEKEIEGASWFVDGRIRPNGEFADWSSLHAQTEYAGKELEEWTAEAEKAGGSWKCPFATP
ncbi:hypothetical protein ACIBCT_29000 [Streptosporangium sp. NPDC050855]|uniref:hypothetical protein n=1 Tax=Streptosporangium sp. NPDC050855 TaxID=3366194 RepID=UPI0037AF9EF7